MPPNNSRPVFSRPSGGETSPKSKDPKGLAALWRAYRLRWRRRLLLIRALRKRHELSPCKVRLGQINPDSILCFATIRNERARLPYFLDHHRALGVGHFLIVVNDSDDDSAAFLAEQPDVSVWTTDAGYKQARFGMDWLNLLLLCHGHGHWCLTLDADELLVFDKMEQRGLRGLTADLEARGHRSFGALMIDLYPKGPLGQGHYTPGQDPVEVIPYLDAGHHRAMYRADMQNLWVQGGVRDRVFFEDRPHRAPTLSKVPLVKWSRRYAYVSSTHTLLPRLLNHVYDRETGALLHTKFLPEIIEKSREEAGRGAHFANDAEYQSYYAGIIAGPDLWCPASVRYEGPEQLVDLGLMTPATEQGDQEAP